jgi:hypothetical protein
MTRIDGDCEIRWLAVLEDNRIGPLAEISMELCIGKKLHFFGNDWERSRKRLRQTPKGLSEDQCQQAVSGAFLLA